MASTCLDTLCSVALGKHCANDVRERIRRKGSFFGSDVQCWMSVIGGAVVSGAYFNGRSAARARKSLHTPHNFGEIEILARPHHTHGLVAPPVEVPWSGVHRDDEVGARRQRALRKRLSGSLRISCSSVKG